MILLSRNGLLLSDEEIAECVRYGRSMYGRTLDGRWFTIDMAKDELDERGSGNCEFNYQQGYGRNV